MVNWFEQYYSELVSYAAACVINNELPLQAEDLVNDAYIKFYESGEDFDKEVIKKYITQSVYAEKGNQNKLNVFSSNHSAKREHRITGDKVCKMCHEVKPVNAFRLKQFKGEKVLSGKCRKCESKSSVEYKRLHREQWNEYIKSRYKKKTKKQTSIHAAWIKANKKYQAKQKLLLTDVYVRNLLKSKIKNPTPQQIEEKRQQLQAKRREANALAHSQKAA